MAVAKTIAENVLEELNRFSTTDTMPDAFTSARLRREIAKLGKVDVVGKQLCDAILATVEGREADARRNFIDILKYQPDNPDMHQNFAYSLSKFGRISEAHKHYLATVDHTDQTAKLLIDLAESSLIVYRPGDLVAALERNSKKINMDDIVESGNIRKALQLHELFTALDIDENESNQIYNTTEEFKLENNLKVVSGYFRSTGAYGGAKITFYASIEGDSEYISEMNMRFCDKLIDNDQGSILKNVTYAFVPFNESDMDWLDTAIETDGTLNASYQ
ncbi:hypothetical protein [Pseudomonas orientalis]|jgi:hypothetical protein|uniref:hypothetical protein n=1 Tax=Pseudomonas orientalis TaxID=76758 RepID=UPI001022E024|nr:hypothetical protein [Pseudomonas orientalis]RZI27700.1 hypothetical protein EUX53_03850 [Pseudomonas orientalis]